MESMCRWSGSYVPNVPSTYMEGSAPGSWVRLRAVGVLQEVAEQAGRVLSIITTRANAELADPELS